MCVVVGDGGTGTGKQASLTVLKGFPILRCLNPKFCPTVNQLSGYNILESNSQEKIHCWVEVSQMILTDHIKARFFPKAMLLG